MRIFQVSTGYSITHTSGDKSQKATTSSSSHSDDKIDPEILTGVKDLDKEVEDLRGCLESLKLEFQNKLRYLEILRSGVSQVTIYIPGPIIFIQPGRRQLDTAALGQISFLKRLTESMLTMLCCLSLQCQCSHREQSFNQIGTECQASNVC